MKRTLALLLAAVLLFAFSGCSLLDVTVEQVIQAVPTETAEATEPTAAIAYTEAPTSAEYIEIPLETTQATEQTEPQTTAAPSNVDILDFLNSEQIYQLNIFLSNFSEQGFRAYPCSDEDLIHFGYIYAKINNHEVLGNNGYEYYIHKGNMDSIMMRFFDRDAPIPANSPEMRYHDGTYFFPAADGESRAYCSVATSMVPSGNGTYSVDFAVYALNDPHGSMSPYYRMNRYQIINCSELTYMYSGSAVIRDYTRSNGVESYQLISYTT